MVEAAQERMAEARLAAAFAARAVERQARAAAALGALAGRCAALAEAVARGEAAGTEAALRGLGAAEASLAELREELDGVADHLRAVHESSLRE